MSKKSNDTLFDIQNVIDTSESTLITIGEDVTIDATTLRLSQATDSIRFDLQGHTLKLLNNLSITFGSISFENGTIDCNECFITAEGTAANLILNTIKISEAGAGGICVIKRGSAHLIDSTIEVGEGIAVYVEGSGIAKDNSSVRCTRTTITAPTAIKVIKGGSAEVGEGSKVSSIIGEGLRTSLDLASGCVDTANIHVDKCVNIKCEDPIDVAEEPIEVTHTADEIEAAPAETAEEAPIEPPAEPEVVASEPEPVEVKKEVEEEVEAPESVSAPSRSIILKKPVQVYGAPSTKSYICTVAGAVTKVGEIGDFAKITFKVPGDATRKRTGYISKKFIG